jgi:trans-2,3-dihydro-3-hydroxyanthranilate isomerase
VRGPPPAPPQPLEVLGEIDPGEVAACVGLSQAQIVTRSHRPTRATVGLDYVIAQVADEAISAAVPDPAAFARTAAAHGLGARLPILLYCRSDTGVRARMFAPLVGTPEDPATGGAMTILGALLLSLSDQPDLAFDVSQGVEMGRPSVISVRAWRSNGSIHAGVAGECVPVLTGQILL